MSGRKVEHSWETFCTACRVTIDNPAQVLLSLSRKGKCALHLSEMDNRLGKERDSMLDMGNQDCQATSTLSAWAVT